MNFFTTRIIEILNKNHWTLSTIESVTGGMISSNLVSIPNASKCFFGGYVTYTNFAKEKIAGISPKILDQYGAISKETAKAMVLNVTRNFQTDFGIAITGNAGPNSIEGKATGLAYLAIAIIDKVEVYELQSELKNRNDIRIDLTSKSISIFYDILNKLDKIKST